MQNIEEILSQIKHISTDSRTIAAGDLFIAIQGDKFDGHNFVADVLNRGARFAIVEHLVPGADTDKQIVVPNTRIAYLEIGGVIRRKSRARVIALTGSAGKTTTKEELKFVLSQFASVYATTGNHNNDIGVAQTLCEMPADIDFAVIELGMSHAGEIAEMVKFVAPDIAIITNVYPMHLENFADITGIARAKSEIFNGLSPNGTAVINANAQSADILLSVARTHTKNIITFDGAGLPATANANCVMAVVKMLGLDTNTAAHTITEFSPLPGRGRVYTLSLPGGGTYTLMDESYSAQPESVKLAITNFANLNGARKIAVIGAMAEIGEKSREMHIEIGRTLAAANIDIVVGICPETRDILAQLRPDQKQFYFADNTELEKFLTQKLLLNGDAVLIKGSHWTSRLFETAEKLLGQGTKPVI